MRSIQSLAGAPQERAENRGATTRRLLGELRPYSRSLLLAFALVVVGALSQAGGPWLIGRAIDRYILGDDPAGLFRTMALLFGVYVAGTLATRGQIRQVGSVGQKVLASMRERIFERLQRLPLRYFDRHPVGDLMSRVTNDVDTLNQLLSHISEASGFKLDPQYFPARAGDVRDSLASIDRARALIGYEPKIDVREGLRRTFAAFKAMYA